MKLYKRKIVELQHSLELSKAENQKLIMEKDALNKSVTFENQKSKRKMNSLHQRHRQLVLLLNQVPTSAPNDAGLE